MSAASRLAPCILWSLVWLAFVPGAAGAETTAEAERSAAVARIGAAPDLCASVSEGHEVCTWFRRRSEHVVCELGASDLLGGECLHTPNSESMLVFDPPKRRKGARRPRKRQDQVDAANATLDAARHLSDVIRLVGAGPVWCFEDDGLQCSWFAIRRTPGYVTLARAANVAGKKLSLLCRFPGALEPRGPDSCALEVRGRPLPSPAPPVSAAPPAVVSGAPVPESVRSCEVASRRLCEARGQSGPELESCIAELSYECVSGSR
jgi:hypothetical protein